MTGYNFLNWYLTLRSFNYSLYVRCILSWGCALGPFRGLSTGQLNCCLPRMEERREEERGRPLWLHTFLPRDAMQTRPIPSCGFRLFVCLSVCPTVCHVREFCQKTPLPPSAYATAYFLFIHEHLIINGKSYCCNDSFTDVRFTSLLAKNI